jgi:hypothetical protein
MGLKQIHMFNYVIRAKRREIQILHCSKWLIFFQQRLLSPGFHLNA